MILSARDDVGANCGDLVSDVDLGSSEPLERPCCLLVSTHEHQVARCLRDVEYCGEQHDGRDSHHHGQLSPVEVCPHGEADEHTNLPYDLEYRAEAAPDVWHRDLADVHLLTDTRCHKN